MASDVATHTSTTTTSRPPGVRSVTRSAATVATLASSRLAPGMPAKTNFGAARRIGSVNDPHRQSRLIRSRIPELTRASFEDALRRPQRGEGVEGVVFFRAAGNRL